MKPLEIFSSPYFDLVFNSVATPHAAKELLMVDVEHINLDARKRIRSIFFHCENQTSDPSARTFLMTARGAQGKTHTLVSEILRKSHSEKKAFPAILQLTANVPISDVDRWLFASIFRQLESKDFASEAGFSPLRDLVDHLAALIPWEFFEGFRDVAFSESATEEEIGNQALDLALRICRVINDQGLDVPDDEFVAALLLTAFRLNPRARAWLFGAEESVHIGKLYLSNVDCNRGDRNIRNLSLCTAAIGSALVICFDQIETAWQVGSEELVQKVISTGVGLVESNPAIGLVISCYFDLYQNLCADHLKQTEQDRIAKGVTPKVVLDFPNTTQIKASVELRTNRLLDILNLPPDPTLPEILAPNWLIKKYASKGNEERSEPLRSFFEALRNYRQRSVESGNLLTEQQWRSGIDTISEDKDEIQIFDFDKLWADAVDQNLATVIQLTENDRASDLVWIGSKLAAEFPNVHTSKSELFTIDDIHSTLVADLKYYTEEGSLVDRWNIALTDNPNINNQLKDQLAEVIANCTETNIAITRKKNIPGVNSEGHGRATIEQVQPGVELNQILTSGGRAQQLTDDAWTRLRLARDFAEEYDNAEGFKDWRTQRRFFTDLADVEGFKRLVQPSSTPDPIAPAIITPPAGKTAPPPEPPKSSRQPDQGENPLDAFSTFIGTSKQQPEIDVFWNVDRKVEIPLENFGVSISGDAGTGKTQLLRVLISEATDKGAPALIFDFKNDYTGEFADKHGFTVYDLTNGIPFNPLAPVPTGPSGCRPIEHVYEVAGVLGDALQLGDIQKSLFRDAMQAAFVKHGVDCSEWQDPQNVPTPSMAEVVEQAKVINEKGATNLINRLGLLHGLNLLPSNTEAQITFPELIDQKSVFLFTNLPADDSIKRAIAELLLIQAHGYLLRGDQPRALRRLFVFDEAHRASKSNKLIQMAREGRAFGLSILAGSQFANDLDPDLTGNLATKIHLYNADGNQRKKIVTQTFGTITGANPRLMLDKLGELQPFEAVVINRQYAPFIEVKILPYFKR